MNGVFEILEDNVDRGDFGYFGFVVATAELGFEAFGLLKSGFENFECSWYFEDCGCLSYENFELSNSSG